MGIRSKILLTFIICFTLMTGISLTLVQRSMTESFEAIEQRDLMAHMTRLQQVIEARIDALNTVTRDWAIWTEMYNFAVNPNAQWAHENMGKNALAPPDLSLLLVYNKTGELLNLQSRDAQGKNLVLPHLQQSSSALQFKQETLKPGCGLMPTDVGLMFACWARIQRSDSTGEFVGNIVMGRLFDDAMVQKMGSQTHLPFALHLGKPVPEGLVRWDVTGPQGSLGEHHFFTAHEPNLFHLFYPLKSWLGDDVGHITLDVSREVHLQSENLLRRIRIEQLLTAIAMALLLFAVIHFLLVRRLRRFESQLIDLADKSTWETRVDVTGSDELGVVAGRVNQLLALIQSQVSDLNALTLSDPLTGLANRRAFDLALDQAYSRELRRKKSLALLMIDVDYFKRYNDHYGHPSGDQVLKKLAQVLSACVRNQVDLAARIGGEEFAILLPDTDALGAMETAQRIRSKLEQAAIEHSASPVAPRVTISVGLTVLHDEPVEDFVRRADRALYVAKGNGRNRIECANESAPAP